MDGEAAARRLRLALDMFEVGEQMQRQRLRRSAPDVPDHEIDTAVRAWRVHRPGAEDGDCAGPVSRRR